jgi:FkbM family methyltransferase
MRGGHMGWVKAAARCLLGKAVNRHRFKGSLFYRLYLHVRYPEHVRQQKAEKQFYRQALEAVGAKLVFDIGANGGPKAAIFSSLVERVVCVEPDPAAVRILKDRFLYNPKVVVVEKGVGADEGVAKFYMFEDADGYNTFSPKWADTLATTASPDRPLKTAKAVVDIPVTTLDQLIKEYGTPSYIKIDVEGYELHVIKGLTSAVPLLSFECNLPEFAPETAECLSTLAERFPAAKFNYCADPPARFECEQWVPYEKMSTIVETGGNRFMEIFCRPF